MFYEDFAENYPYLSPITSSYLQIALERLLMCSCSRSVHGPPTDKLSQQCPHDKTGQGLTSCHNSAYMVQKVKVI